MILKEFDELHKRQQMRMKKHFIKIAKDKEAFAKYYNIFNEMLNFDGEKNENKNEKKEKVMI